MNGIVYFYLFPINELGIVCTGLVYIYISLIKFDQLSTMGVNKGQ